MGQDEPLEVGEATTGMVCAEPVIPWSLGTTLAIARSRQQQDQHTTEFFKVPIVLDGG